MKFLERIRQTFALLRGRWPGKQIDIAVSDSPFRMSAIATIPEGHKHVAFCAGSTEDYCFVRIYSTEGALIAESTSGKKPQLKFEPIAHNYAQPASA